MDSCIQPNAGSLPCVGREWIGELMYIVWHSGLLCCRFGTMHSDHTDERYCFHSVPTAQLLTDGPAVALLKLLSVQVNHLRSREIPACFFAPSCRLVRVGCWCPDPQDSAAGGSLQGACGLSSYYPHCAERFVPPASLCDSALHRAPRHLPQALDCQAVLRA